MYDYFGHGFNAISVIKHLKAKKTNSQMGDPSQMGVRGLICVGLGVLDVKTFENDWFKCHSILVSKFLSRFLKLR